MAKCATCRKSPIQDTFWDKVRLFFFHLFVSDIYDLRQDSFTQGVGDGYRRGYEHGHDNAAIEQQAMTQLLQGKRPDPITSTIPLYDAHDSET